MSTFLFLRFSSGLVNRQPVFLIPLAIASTYSKPSSELPAVISCATVLPDSLHTLLWLDLPVLYLPQRSVLETEERFSNKPAETETPYKAHSIQHFSSRWLIVSHTPVLSS